jgi:hypothetical protein
MGKSIKTLNIRGRWLGGVSVVFLVVVVAIAIKTFGPNSTREFEKPTVGGSQTALRSWNSGEFEIG